MLKWKIIKIRGFSLIFVILVPSQIRDGWEAKQMLFLLFIFKDTIIHHFTDTVICISNTYHTFHITLQNVLSNTKLWKLDDQIDVFSLTVIKKQLRTFSKVVFLLTIEQLYQ